MSSKIPVLPENTNLVELANTFIRESRASATRRAYSSDLLAFVAWCSTQRRRPLPATPKTVAAYIAQLGKDGRKPSSIDRALTSISQAHEWKRYKNPVRDVLVRETRKGMRRTLKTAQKKAQPITLSHLMRMVAALGTSNASIELQARDAAILCLGWAAALRRSEIVAVDVGDIHEVPEGIILNLKSSKTDQEGEGREIGIPFGSEFCIIRVLRRWQSIAEISEGALFRRIRKGGQITGDRLTDRSVDRVVKRTAKLAGYSEVFSTHGLRAGLITTAAEAGISDRQIMVHSGHRSPKVFSGYVRHATVFVENPLSRLLK